MALVTLFANNPSTTTTSTSGTTAPAALTTETWTVTSSAAFPAAATGVSQFHIADPALPAEIIAVTNVSGTTWSVTRGTESTTPIAHATGATYYQVVSASDLTALAPKDSPALTGTPTSPTASALTSTTQLATTAYTDSAVGVETSRATTAEALKAPLASPALTGSPTAPTQTAADNTTKIATDAFVTTAVATETTRATTAEALALPKTGGTLTGAVISAPVVLTDAASITVSATTGNSFKVTLGGNRTLANPSSPADGQVITVEVIQDGTGSRQLAYGTAYQFPASIGTPVLSAAAGSRDFLSFQYNLDDTTWWCTGFVPSQIAAAVASVAQGGTGDASLTAYALLAGGTTSTGAVQQVASLGTSGWVLTSNGPGALPTFQVASSGFSNPMTTLGDLIYENASPAPARLAGSTSATKNFLAQTGTGSLSAAPTWGTIAAGDLPAATTGTQGAVILDGTASDIQKVGTAAAAGSVGKAPDAGHVHLGFFGGIFGTGNDGSVTFDGTTTILSMVPSSNVYTLLRDIHCTSITVNSGVTIKTANCRIFCRGTITNNGTVANNGSNAIGSAGGLVSVSNSFGGGRAGGAGGTGVNGAGGAGTIAPTGVASGAGGAGTSGTGGAGQTPAVPMANLQNQCLQTPNAILMGYFQLVLNSGAFEVGASGGGGGSDASSNAGGGGGGGSGVLALLAYAVVNNGTLSAVGGNGANGVAGNAGGGGGGSGGLIIAYTLSAWTAGTTAVTGGTAGNGSGTGSNGNAGTTGLVLNVVLG